MLYIKPDIQKLNNEFLYYLSSKPSLNIISPKNYIIKYFQQDIFYKTEKELYTKSQDIAYKIILNRIKYLNKSIDQLSSLDLLDGFKKSGIYYGYSHFNPNLFKWFINKYQCKKCYDPCGGWGHRLLGSLSLDTYIYNDLSTSIFNNVKNIIQFFEIDKLLNIKLYNNDAIDFIPNDQFDSIFTCPPYYNLETYDCPNFNNINEYNQLLNNIYNIYLNNPECKVYGIVIREDLVIHHNYKYKFNIKSHKVEHLLKNSTKKFNEFLYIYIK